MEEYVKEFEFLLIRCELMEPQEQTIARFLGGLRKDIANVVELQPYIFLEEVIKLATRVEAAETRCPNWCYYVKHDKGCFYAYTNMEHT